MENKNLYEKLSYKNKNIYEKINDEEKKEVFAFSNGYKIFLDMSKTERESIQTALELAKSNGFVDMAQVQSINPGDKLYLINRGKNIVLFVAGKEDILKGVNLVGAHVDAPRLDIKPNPLYEADGMAWLKTHYYGGIKKYQWTTVPLAMHGVICLRNGKKIQLNIGEKQDEPIFFVTDLLPHLADSQVTKPAHKAIEGEKLNILVGSIPLVDEDIKEQVKFNILKYLHETYGIIEEDFISAEIEMVPAEKARDVGFDRSMVGAYGHDDRVCGYSALKGILEVEHPSRTAICLLIDKEETGSDGTTGIKSRFLECALTEFVEKMLGKCSLSMINRVFTNSMCLSGDVSAAVDPNYDTVNERMNAAFVNHGIAISKYTGARGKGSTSDADAEYVAKIRNLFNENNVAWQMAELGKVDEGGGGTIAKYVANLNIDTIDCGTALLCMHAPMEIASKADIYMTYKAYKCFYFMV